jgi:hypothetical protein
MRSPAGGSPAPGRRMVCAPDEVDRLARDRARSGERVASPGPEPAGGRGMEWMEDSGP